MGPTLSVVMPVHNAAAYLNVSVPSILNQTFKDFELIVRDDGSDDGSREQLREWAGRDERIRLFEGEQLGPAAAGNFVVAEARAPLIARMDADDIAHPDRLRRQIEVMAASPDIALLGTSFDVIDQNGEPLRPYNVWRLRRASYSVPFTHSSVLFTRRVFERVGGYRQACEYWEDLDFFLRVAAVGRISILADQLVSYRQAHTSARLTSDRAVVEQALDRRCRCLDEYRLSGDYRRLLEQLESTGPATPLHPMSFVFLSSLELWSRCPSRVLRQVLRRAELRWNLRSAAVLLWAVWATVSPASLRWTLKSALKVGNFLTGGKIGAGQIYEWMPRAVPSRAERRFRSSRVGPWLETGAVDHVT